MAVKSEEKTLVSKVSLHMEHFYSPAITAELVYDQLEKDEYGDIVVKLFNGSGKQTCRWIFSRADILEFAQKCQEL